MKFKIFNNSCRYNPEDQHPHLPCRDSLKCHKSYSNVCYCMLSYSHQCVAAGCQIYAHYVRYEVLTMVGIHLRAHKASQPRRTTWTISQNVSFPPRIMWTSMDKQAYGLNISSLIKYKTDAQKKEEVEFKQTIYFEVQRGQLVEKYLFLSFQRKVISIYQYRCA